MENSLFQNVYNPDVLSCIANLSNDEILVAKAVFFYGKSQRD